MSAGGGMARRPTQCDRVLEVLDDGLWHSIHEIHDRAGSMRLNSRVSELRARRGLDIQQRQQRDPRTGERVYGYQLLGPKVSAETPRAEAAAAGRVEPAWSDVQRWLHEESPASAAEQAFSVVADGDLEAAVQLSFGDAA